MRHKPAFIAVIAGIGLLAGWCIAGTDIIAGLNPALRHELALAAHPALDVWITPPTGAGSATVALSTPAALLFEHDTVAVPQGSVVSAHLAEQEGDAPQLAVDDAAEDFTTDPHGDFAASRVLTAGHNLTITRDGDVLAQWKIEVQADRPPQVALTEPMTLTAGKSLRVAYDVADDRAVASVALRVTPRDPQPGADNRPVDIPLAAEQARHIARVDFADLSDRPWAGQTVAVQLVATNPAGETTASVAVDMAIPARSFVQPIARVLIQERQKLMQRPDDEALREEAANIMAGISHQVGENRGDPVLLMALRSGAVRLILDNSHTSVLSVNDLLWQAAARIEDGSSGQAEQMLRDARQDLADAVGRKADDQEIQALNAQLQKKMQSYLSALSARRRAAHQDYRTQAILSKIR